MPDTANFFVSLALIPVMGFAAVWIVSRMVQGDLGVAPGLAGLGALVVLMMIAVLVPDQKMTAPVFLVTVVTMAFFPFAETYLERTGLDSAETDRLDKAHRELAVRPENVPARFDLARALNDRGLSGHAIAIAEDALNGLSTQRDPMSNRSQRDLFVNEDIMVKKWRRELKDPRAFEPVKCPDCGQPNPPGTLACSKCKGPYLLSLARKADHRGKIVGRLLFGWSLTAGLLVGCAWIGMAVKWPDNAGFIAVLIAAIGGVMTWLFRPRTLRD